MDSNPYQSPIHRADIRPKNRARRFAAFAVVWCFFFLLPTLVVVLTQYFPVLAFTQLPLRESVLGRISLSVNARADLAFPISFVGCTLIGVLSPLKMGWKIAVLLGWFPLSLAQLFTIVLGLYWATGFMYT
jgi:hypothetical protein